MVYLTPRHDSDMQDYLHVDFNVIDVGAKLPILGRIRMIFVFGSAHGLKARTIRRRLKLAVNQLESCLESNSIGWKNSINLLGNSVFWQIALLSVLHKCTKKLCHNPDLNQASNQKVIW